MKPPRRVLVSPFVVEVTFARVLPDASGTCSPDHGSIVLSEEQQAEAQQRDTVLHELLHTVIAQGLGAPLKELDKAAEEMVVGFLAPRILGLLRDNPKLVEYLTER